MSKSKKERNTSHDAIELILVSVRINELRSLRLRLFNDIYLIRSTCQNSKFTRASSTINNMSLLISEIDARRKSLTRRSRSLMVRMIKLTNKTFQEKPSELVPLHNKDIETGYVELTEVTEQGELIPHLLLLDSGKIEPANNVRAKQIMARGPSYTGFTFDKIKALAIMSETWPR